MIEQIFIPTYRRVDMQLTYDSLPKKWQNKTCLVVHSDEFEELSKRGYNCVICPHQGPPPNDDFREKFGIAAVRQWIHEDAIRYGIRKYAVMDDDVHTFLYNVAPDLLDEHNGLKNAIINYPTKNGNTKLPTPGYEGYFDEMMNKFSRHLDEVCTAGPDNSWTFPKQTSHQYNFRQTIVHFVNTETFPRDIDWTGIQFAEDYYILLQLMTSGHQNIIEHRFRISAGATQAAGGCATARSIERHNTSMEQIQAKYPDYVKLTEKEIDSGPWKGETKYTATIKWKKAYEDSQKLTNGLDEFF